MSASGITRIGIRTNLPWQCLQTTSGNWIAVCDPLNLTVQSETWAELMEDIGDTLQALFEDLLISNDLARFLIDHGWEAAGPLPSHMDEPVRFDVPFSTTMMGASYV